VRKTSQLLVLILGAAGMTDPLSEVLRAVRLTGGVFLDAQFTAPWCVLSKITAEDCRFALAAATQVIAYHFIIDGRLILTVEGERPIEVRAGEVVLLPRNDAHTLASSPGLAPVNARDLIKSSVGGGLVEISHGGGAIACISLAVLWQATISITPDRFTPESAQA
jgi:hypothetical protein